MSPATHTRELAARESNGIHVLLLWHPARTLTVGRGRPRRRPLPARGRARRALDAFYHPFAYAAVKGETTCPHQDTSSATWRPGWAAGAPPTGRPRRSAGSPSSSSPSASAAWSASKSIDPNTSGPGESGRVDRILDAGFKQPRRGERPDPERTAPGGRLPRSTPSCADAAARASQRCAVVQHDPAADAASKNGHAALVDFEIRGDEGQGRRQDRSLVDARRGGAGGPSGLLHRRVRRRERADGGRRRPTARTWARPGCSRSRSRSLILLVTFGALVAAGIPLLLALTAVFAHVRADRAAEPRAPDGE